MTTTARPPHITPTDWHAMSWHQRRRAQDRSRSLQRAARTTDSADAAILARLPLADQIIKAVRARNPSAMPDLAALSPHTLAALVLLLADALPPHIDLADLKETA